MHKRLLAFTIGAALLALSGGAAFAQSAQWIHVRVLQEGGAKVSVNLPISLIEVALDIAGKEVFKRHGGLHFGRHHDVDLADLRKMWNELREAGDAEYVSVDGKDGEQVRIFRQDDRVMIQVDEDGEEKVRVEVPFSVVDTLLEGDGDELNLIGALREMANANDGDIITVHDGDTDVRVWIDTNSQS